ncbi:expressed unknown protein [Seminavis robusta]|uniref:Uncharacterized protein n=1 Tax=Seminavis robusta TaxID=568900 RepID=A0A9N8E2G5_9STRA|nr:expressed unknown protein [Seminavis robusta]|eukprot:Sro586_g171190.1 n/a (317) ;mRNA; f:37643-38593
MPKRVKVLPQKFLGKNTPLPPEPSEPPPPTTDLVSLLVVGSPQSGKTSLIESFVSHETVDPCHEDTTQEEAVLRQCGNNWSVSYSRKKFAFRNQENNSCIQSLFVQLLEATGIDPNTATTIDKNQSEWKRVWRKAAVILLVVNVSQQQQEEEETDSILRQIKTWKRWLDARHQPQKKKKAVILMLHQGDKLSATTNTDGTTTSSRRSATFWIDLGKKISHLCDKLDIHSWHITSSNLLDDELGGSVDAAFCRILGDPQSSGVLSSPPPASIVTTTNHGASFDAETQLLSPPTDDTVTPIRAKRLVLDSARVVSPLT